MNVFNQLRALREFEKENFRVLKTVEDYDLIREIGHRQALGAPPTIKQLLLLDVGSIATVQRRLRRLKTLGVVQHRRSPADRRAVELTLSPPYVSAFAKYEVLLAEVAAGAEGKAPTLAISQNHSCAVYDREPEFLRIVVPFLAQGLQQGESCRIYAGPGNRDAIISALGRRQRRSTDPQLQDALVATDYLDTPAAQIADIRGALKSAAADGRPVRFAGDAAAALDRGWTAKQVTDYEKRLRKLLAQNQATVLCLYDLRRFPNSTLLTAFQNHKDGPNSAHILL